MKFDTKPFQVEAVQFTGDNLLDVQEFCGVLADGNSFAFRRTKDQRKEWPADEIIAKVYDYLHDTWVGVKLNQWIIRGMKGELYPCDDEVLKAKYQPSLSERTKNLAHSADAQEWASVWMEYMKTKPHIAFDEGAMLCWFSNAIMAGYDEGKRQIKSMFHPSVFEQMEKFAASDVEHYSMHDADCPMTNSDPDARTTCVCDGLVAGGGEPIRDTPEGSNSADLTPEQTGDGDGAVFTPERAIDGLLTVLQDEADKATQEASNDGMTSSIRKDTGIDG